MMKKNDLILIGALLIAAVLLYGGFWLMGSEEGRTVEISVQGEILCTLPLWQDTTYVIETAQGESTLTIRDDEVFMQQACCPDHRCVKQGAIRRTGETICCLPQQILVTITGEDTKANPVDGVAH